MIDELICGLLPKSSPFSVFSTLSVSPPFFFFGFVFFFCFSVCLLLQHPFCFFRWLLQLLIIFQYFKLENFQSILHQLDIRAKLGQQFITISTVNNIVTIASTSPNDIQYTSDHHRPNSCIENLQSYQLHTNSPLHTATIYCSCYS